MYTRKRLTLLITIFILAGAALSMLTPTILRHVLVGNRWSIQMLPAVLQGVHDELSPPPETHPNRCVWLARTATNQGYQQQAINCFSSIEIIQSPLHADALARMLNKIGQYDQAFEIWQDIDHPQALQSAGREAQSNQNFALAYQAYQAVSVLVDDVFQPRMMRVLIELEKYEEAVDYLIEFKSTLDPIDFSNWWRTLGDNYRNMFAWHKAEAAYYFALESDPNNYRAWIGLGWIAYDRDNNVTQAEVYFKEAITAAPDLFNGYYAIGNMLYQEQQFEDSIEWFEHALEFDQEPQWLLLLYATALRRMGHYDQALTIYNQLVSLHPEFAHAYHELAWAYYETGRLSEALTAIETALELMDPPNIWFYVRAGRVYEENQQLDQALAAYQAALEIEPNNSAALQGVERLTGEQ